MQKTSVMPQTAKIPAHLLPHHLRPEVQEQKRKDHPALYAPQDEDFDNEFYLCEGMRGMRCYAGNKHT